MTTKATGTGTRARSREIGYSDAMREIGSVLRTEAHRWTEGAKHEDPLLGMAFTLAAVKLREVARYAEGVNGLYLDHRSPLEEGSLVQLDWRLKGSAPRELPPHEQSDN